MSGRLDAVFRGVYYTQRVMTADLKYSEALQRNLARRMMIEYYFEVLLLLFDQILTANEVFRSR